MPQLHATESIKSSASSESSASDVTKLAFGAFVGVDADDVQLIIVRQIPLIAACTRLTSPQTFVGLEEP